MFLRRLWESLLSVGAYSGETDIRRGRRRIVVGYILFGSFGRFFGAVDEFGGGLLWVGVLNVASGLVTLGALGVLRLRPQWFIGVVNVLLFSILAENLAETVILGGLVPSAMAILFGLLGVIGALIVLSVRAALWWSLAYVATVVLAAALPNWIEPLHEFDVSGGDIAESVIGFTIFLFAGMAYFVRQRDRFQAESDDLLHNILPDEIAQRLKAERAMIADDYPAASVLFADVVDFTPMSQEMAPAELVGLLNSVFSTFDGFVEDLGLEKIKTVGDEYMVAAGVPVARPDHAHAIAELALRIRDHADQNGFDGRDLRLRIGINSGPVVAGIVGTHKFSYDLWGDVVNTASRMESTGIPGSIQITTETYELIQDHFECEARGPVPVKGKGDMETYLLTSRRTQTKPTT